MKLIKLALISIVVFTVLLWGITLMFPSNTVISRAANIHGSADSLFKKVKTNEISLTSILAATNNGVSLQAADIPFYEDNLFNALNQSAVPAADTLFFRLSYGGKAIAEGGMAFYQLVPDSATTQVFYVFQTPWYQPLKKMKMMVADKVYGPGLDSALLRLKNKMQ
ncbi:MAG TPA: hypothetical protein VLL95_11475 [Phnomibacter sp.]|nr:hypothetical protein [Phnomibacter sp.]